MSLSSPETRPAFLSLRWFKSGLDWIDRHDALTLLKSRTRTPAGLTFFSLLCLFPVLGHIVSRIAKGRPWFNDYEAVVCAAQTVAMGHSPYSLDPQCIGMQPAPYVYAPQIAEILAPLTQMVEITYLKLGYAFILIPMIMVSLYLNFRVSAGSGFRRLSLLSLTAMGGGAVASGNIGFVLLGLMVLGVLCLERTPWPFVIFVLIAAPIKPIYLAFALVLLYRQGDIRQRLTAFFSLCATGLLVIAMVWLNAGPLSGQWQQSLKAIALTQQPGIGFFALTTGLGLDTGIPVLIAYCFYALILMAGGFYICERGRFDAQSRLLLGTGMALLINPRLMDYDMLPLGPFMAMLLFKAREDMGQALFSRLSWAYTVPLCVCLIANILEIDALHRAPFAILSFSLITLSVFGLYAVRDPNLRRLSWARIRVPVDLKAQP